MARPSGPKWAGGRRLNVGGCRRAATTPGHRRKRGWPKQTKNRTDLSLQNPVVFGIKEGWSPWPRCYGMLYGSRRCGPSHIPGQGLPFGQQTRQGVLTSVGEARSSRNPGSLPIPHLAPRSTSVEPSTPDFVKVGMILKTSTVNSCLKEVGTS